LSIQNTSTSELKKKIIIAKIRKLKHLPEFLRSVLTCVTQIDSVIHDVTQQSHDATEKSQKYPVLSDFGKSVAPCVGYDPEKSRCPFAPIRPQFFISYLFLPLVVLLQFA
jgi:Fe-S-cluster containining protein